MKHLNSIAPRFSLSVVTVLLFTAFAAEAQWVYVGQPEFSEGQARDVSLDVYNGIPYIAFTDHAYQMRTSVMKYNGSDWVFAGPPGFTAPTPDVFDISFKINAGIPHIAFFDRSFSDGAIEGKLTVMKQNDGWLWTYVGTPGISPGNIREPLLATEGGAPYVAFIDETQGDKLSVMKYDGSDWVQVGPAVVSANTYIIEEYSFEVHDGTPYVAYQDKSLGRKAVVKKFDGTAWVNVGDPGFSGDAYSEMDFALSDSGTPFLARIDSATNQRVTVLRFNGNEWEVVGLPEFSPASISSHCKLDIDGESPCVAFNTGYPVAFVVLRYNGTAWDTIGTPVVDAAMSPLHLNLVIDNGIPYVGFQHKGFGGGATLMKYIETSSTGDVLPELPNFQIYPNPAHDIANIQLPDCPIEALSVFDATGRWVQDVAVPKESAQATLDVSAYMPGIYFLRIRTAAGEVAAGTLVVLH